MAAFFKTTDVISLCQEYGFDYKKYVDFVLQIGDVVAIRKDKAGNPFRRNYERAMVLLAVAYKYKSKKFLEFGTGRGFVSGLLSSLDNISFVYTIDKLNGLETESALNALNGLIISKIGFVKKNSLKMKAEDFPFADFDLVFIDGEHTEKAVRNDFDLALKCTTDDAVIVFDDYRNKHKGVKEFIKSLKYDKMLVSSDGWIYENRLIKEHGDADKVIDGKEQNSGQVVLFKSGRR